MQLLLVASFFSTFLLPFYLSVVLFCIKSEAPILTIKYTTRDHRILTTLSVSAEDESQAPFHKIIRLGEKSIREIDLLSDFSVVKSRISKLFSPEHEGTETSLLLLNKS